MSSLMNTFSREGRSRSRSKSRSSKCTLRSRSRSKVKVKGQRSKVKGQVSSCTYDLLRNILCTTTYLTFDLWPLTLKYTYLPLTGAKRVHWRRHSKVVVNEDDIPSLMKTTFEKWRRHSKVVVNEHVLCEGCKNGKVFRLWTWSWTWPWLCISL